MRHLSKLLYLIAALTVLLPQFVAADSTPSFAHLLVQGEATTEVAPDKATITLRVVAFDANANVASQTVQKQLMEVLRVLAEFSVPEKAITSHSLSKSIERERVERSETNILGYFISRRMEIELTDLSNFSGIASKLAELENISSLNANFDVSERDRHETQLMQEAATDARRTAQAMLHGTDRQLGPVHAIAENSFSSNSAQFEVSSGTYRVANMMAYDSAPYSKTIFEPTTIQLRQTLHIIYALK